MMAPGREHSEMHRRQRAKNQALVAVLAGLAAMFHLITPVKPGDAG